MAQCLNCGKEISNQATIPQCICDECIGILAEIKARQDDEMQKMFDS